MWLSGYRKTLEGAPFPYHSIAPEIRSALLVRGNAERPTVAWETAPFEGCSEDGFARFVWVFAMAADPAKVRFTLSANEEPVLAFSNPAGFDDQGWVFDGERGASLRLRVTHQDRHGDPMGYAMLRLPAASLPVGEPVRLRITGEDRGVPTWAMVFEHEVTPSIQVDPLPLVRRADGESVHWIRLRTTHLGEDGEAVIRHRDDDVARQTLTFGPNTVPIPMPATNEPRPISLEIEIDGRRQDVTFEQRPLRPWVVHLVQHTHTDIGYTRSQTEILPEHLRFLDLALDLCDQTDDWPDEARFRWTCEASWPLREFLRSRPPSQIERLRRRVEEGRIELTAMMFNLAEVIDETSLLALLEPVGRLREAGLPVRLAMQNDVNGFAWCLADALPTLGVDSFVMGQHTHRALACFERPTAFWWESPSGSALLGFRGEHYMTANEWGIHGTDLASFGASLLQHLQDVEASDYPFDRLEIQYGGYLTDNAPPSLAGPSMIRRWNETYLWPRLETSSAGAFLDWVREHHGTDLPVHAQAWPDWWTDGFGSAARETAAARRASGELVAVQGLAAMALARGLGLPPDWAMRVEEAYDALLFWDEHTLGAAESISDPACENSQVQWGEKAAYAWEAVKRTRLLQEAALGWLAPSLPTDDGPTLVVLNPLGFDRSGTVDVFIDHGMVPPERTFALVDPVGREVPTQPVGRRSDGTTWRVHLSDVPALGHTTLRIEVRADDAEAPLHHDGLVLENEHYRIELDPETGAARQVLDKARGEDLVDPEAEWGFFQLVHEALGDRHQLERKTLETGKRRGMENVRVERGVDGAVYRSLVVCGTVPGSTEPDGVRIEIRLFQESKRIQVQARIRKLPVTDPEAVYLAFPFRLPDAEVVYEAQGGSVVPGVDQLPGSSSDWHTVQGFVVARNEETQVALTSVEVPLWQLGGLHLGRFAYRAEVETPHLYAWLLNNYWVTNFKASQEGELVFHVDLVSGPRQPLSAATRFGRATHVPLVARVMSATSEATGKAQDSILRNALPANLTLVGTRPSTDGHALFLHLRETDGRDATLDVARVFGPRPEAAIVDALGGSKEAVEGAIEILPFGVLYLRLEVPDRP